MSTYKSKTTTIKVSPWSKPKSQPVSKSASKSGVDKEVALLKAGWVKDQSIWSDKGNVWRYPTTGETFYEDSAYELMVYLKHTPNYIKDIIHNSHDRIVSLEKEANQLRSLLGVDMKYIPEEKGRFKLFFTNPKRWYQFWK